MKAGMADIDDSNLSKLHNLVEEHLPPKTMERKVYGEVFTPLALVKEMLEAIVKYADKDFWKNPNLKILDPAAGIGNFPLIAFEKLMDGLKEAIPSRKKRKRHILEKMLYMVELNANNVRLMKKIFNAKEYKLNIIRGDFLAAKTQAALAGRLGMKEPKFDLVMGNPPFQGVQEAEGKRGGGDQIWDDFVKVCIAMLGKGGVMTFIHPSGWRKPESSKSKYKGMFQSMTRTCQMHYLEIHDKEDGVKTFQSGTRYDWYVLSHRTPTQKTVVRDEKGVLSNQPLLKMDWLPNYNFANVFKLVALPGEKTCKVIYSGAAYETRKPWVKDDKWVAQHDKNKAFKKVLIHTTPKGGVTYRWTNDLSKDKEHNVPMFGVTKVIFGETGVNVPVEDINGSWGMTQEAIAIKCERKEIQALVSFLVSQSFSNIMEACQWSNYRVDWRLFAAFKERFWEVKLSNRISC